MIQANVVTTEEQVMVTKEKKSLQITIDVDEEFIKVINGLGETDQYDCTHAGMSGEEAKAVGRFYETIQDMFNRNENLIKMVGWKYQLVK